jgi:hypothetical protein
MGKHLNFIQKLNELTTQLSKIVDELWNLSNQTSNKELSAELCKFVADYSALNYKLATALIIRTIQAHSQDKALLEKLEFDNIIKPLIEGGQDEEA